MRVSTYMSFKIIKVNQEINREAQNKFNNSVKEPEEAGLFGSGPRETNLLVNTRIKWSEIELIWFTTELLNCKQNNRET